MGKEPRDPFNRSLDGAQTTCEDKISYPGSGNIKKMKKLEEIGADEKISRYTGSRD
jgi:hypothetical protein